MDNKELERENQQAQMQSSGQVPPQNTQQVPPQNTQQVPPESGMHQERYQNPYQVNWQNRKYYGNDYARKNGPDYNNYPNYNPYMNQAGQSGGIGHPEPFEKKSDTGKKLLLIAGVSIFVGLIAGGTFLAVQGLGKMLNKEPEPVVAETETEEPEIGEVETAPASSEAVEKEGVVATDVTAIVEAVMPSVVSVTGMYTYTEDYWGETYSEEYEGGGSGFIIGKNDTELLIATNAHVVIDVEDLKVTFNDESEAEVMVKGVDEDLDVAVVAAELADLSEDTRDAIAIAKLGDSTVLKPGQAVVAIGNALLLGQSVTDGIVSAVNMPVGAGYDELGNKYGSDDRVMIQTTASINPGCSGGVLINMDGEVIGINTMAVSAVEVEGMCYAIPISDAIPVLDRLKEREVREKLKEGESGYLGVTCTNVSSSQAEDYGMPVGVYISKVEENSGADKAGLKKGDIIVGLEGDKVKTVNDLQNMLQYYAVNEKVELEIMRYRDGEYVSRTIEVRLGKNPE